MSTQNDHDTTLRSDEPLTHDQKRTLRYNPNTAVRLLDETIPLATHSSALSHGEVCKFARAGLLTKVGTVPRSEHPQGRDDANLWAPANGVLKHIKKRIEPQQFTPCGCSTGVRNSRDREGYTCKNEDCDETFGREVALAVVNEEPLADVGGPSDE